MEQKILNICVNGIYTDGYTYHENLLPKYQKKNGNEVYILASEYEYDKERRISKTNITEYVDENNIFVKRLKINGNHNILYKFKRFDGFYETLEKIKPDIIFCHLFQFLDVDNVIKYKRKHPEVRVYFDSHADKINSARTILSLKVLHGIIWKHYAKSAYAICEKFYGVSPARVQFLREVYQLPSKKSELLVMGADDDMIEVAELEDTKRETQKRYGVSDSDFVVVTGGKIDKSKWQVMNLMKVADRLPIKLFVFGSISEDIKDEFFQLTTEKVEFIGWLNEQQAYNLFAISQMAVFPSTHSVYWEQVTGQGIPMIVRHWDGFEHLDLRGNLKYIYTDTCDELYDVMKESIYEDQWRKMKKVAEEKGRIKFSYRSLAKMSVEKER